MDNQALAILVAVTLFGAFTVGLVTTQGPQLDESRLTASNGVFAASPSTRNARLPD